ncbi:hypothetical protein AQV86_02695 [Nanohaloarchaea archaeon SG9]|nr:hypothetical protein AQV86_02695 [Nanohaloarchaea archaeon SG9]
MSKGQHLALESVATFGLTLIAAVGVVQMFGQVNDGVVTSTEETQAEVVGDVVRSTVIQMESSSEQERGYHQLELPEKIGGKDYTVALKQGKVLVFTDNNEFSQNFNLGSTDKVQEGSAQGGSVRIFKNSEGYTLRSGR